MAFMDYLLLCHLHYDIFNSMVLVLCSDLIMYGRILQSYLYILVIGGVIGSVWARWGIKHGHKFDKKCEKED